MTIDPETARDHCHSGLLAALDCCVEDAATMRGIPACRGRDEEHAATGCEIAELHTTAGMLAYRISAMIADPEAASADFELAAFHAVLRATFALRPPQKAPPEVEISAATAKAEP